MSSQFAVGGALRIAGTGLSVGLSASVMRSWIKDVRAWSGGGNDVTHEGRSLLDVSGYALGLRHRRPVRAHAARALARSVLSIAAERERWHAFARLARDDIGGPSSADVEVSYDLPDIMRWGARYRPRPSLELRAFGDYTRFFRVRAAMRRGQRHGL